MKNERIEEIVELCIRSWQKDSSGLSLQGSIRQALSTLPEFQEPEWIKCSERMPKENESVYFVAAEHPGEKEKVLVGIGIKYGFCTTVAYIDNKFVQHWRPRYVPAPPVKEESPQVKELRSLLKSTASEEKILEIVKRYEKNDNEK